MTVDKRGQERRDRRPSGPRAEGSATRRLLWAVVGVVAYAVAKYALGF